MLERLKGNRSTKAELAISDAERRAEAVALAETRALEAMATDALYSESYFGQPVNVFEVADARGSMRVYMPDIAAQTAGYVPLRWFEFVGPGQHEGAILEVREEEERLVRAAPVESGVGEKPEGLPVTNTRVMVARATGLLHEGWIVRPSTQTDVA